MYTSRPRDRGAGFLHLPPAVLEYRLAAEAMRVARTPGAHYRKSTLNSACWSRRVRLHTMLYSAAGRDGKTRQISPGALWHTAPCGR
jgi:hypothetical protein